MAQRLGLHWPPPPVISLRQLIKIWGTALVLSGGGAKGSFEVGVLAYMYNTGFHPGLICSTSAGSVNGLKLAEGEGAQSQGFRGLEKIWLGMTRNSDMYVENSWFRNSPGWIKLAIGGGDVGPDYFVVFLGGVIPYLAIWSTSRLSDLKDFLDDITIAHGIYNLQPIADLAKRHIHRELFGTIRLRMATVGLRSGAIKYVSEMGRLLDDPALPSADPGSPQVDVIAGMLASAAIPVFFEAQELAKGTRSADLYVDGGMRQVVPIRAAIGMGATEVYAVVAPIALAEDTDFTSKGLLEIGTRAATDIVIDQITTDNIDPAAGWGKVPVHVIRATIEVQSSRTIDPGLIRINIAYGFMRAFDVLSQRASRPDVQAALFKVSDDIASTRSMIWNIEEKAIYCWGRMIRGLAAQPFIKEPLSPWFSEAVAEVRKLKNALAGLVECRLSIAGAKSLPSDASSWGRSWEAHRVDAWDIANPEITGWPYPIPHPEGAQLFKSFPLGSNELGRLE